MLKINLESELIRQNKSLVSAKELLLINEYDSLGDDTISNNSLIRVFGESSAAHEGKKIKVRVDELRNQTKYFDQHRVFHISQIERLCKKYHLRFLPSAAYKGAIDKETANKISQFEIANSVFCKAWRKEKDYAAWRTLYRYEGGNTYIAAPSSSFELQERPKDPLLFFQINEQYYFLIHKWGNDLNIIRRTYRLLSNAFVSWLVMFLITAPIAGYLWSIGFEKDKPNAFGIIAIVLTIGFVGASLGQIIDQWFRIVKPSEWRSLFDE